MANDDEEALKWAALERLPTYERVRNTLFQKASGGIDQIDVRNLSLLERQYLVDKLLKVTERDNEKFLYKLRRRIDKVGIQLPTIEVRYENVCVEAECYVGDRALPTLVNAARNALESLLGILHLSPTKKTMLNVLNNVNGIVKPGRMTLLLGPPGSGKTTLLLALAGKLSKDLKMSGTITYNGHTLDEFVPQKTSVYISQHDLHVGEMTVRETLDFSARCQGTGTRYEMLEEISRREKEAGIRPEADVDVFMKATAIEGGDTSLATEYTLRLLGLDVCADILIGDEMRRGISGGQRKRVTTGEMIVGPTTALFMDEISTGLDSSTTFSIVSSLRQFVKVLEGTILMSLLQPAPETFDLFDDIILLSEGQIVYHGPRENAMDFFESCGFKCPERKGVADFLQEVTSRKDQAQYWADRQQAYRYVSVADFSEAFKRFYTGSQMFQELSVPYPKERSHKAALATETYAISTMELFKANFAKEVLLMKRNYFIYVFKTLQIILTALISITTFLRTRLQQHEVSDGVTYLGALFFAITTIMFNGFGDLAMTIARLPVVFKQRDLRFYPVWTYAISTFMLSLPISVIECMIWTGITYYVTGYAPEPGRFFRQFFLLVTVQQMTGGLFRFIGGMCRSMIKAHSVGFVTILLFFMLGGFIIPRPYIRVWWVWFYWISPLTYANQALSVNELLAPRWNKRYQNTTTTLGVEVLLSRGLFVHGYWYWIGIGALLGFVVLFNSLFILAITFLDPIGKTQTVISEEALAEREANRMGSDEDGNEHTKRSNSTKQFNSGLPRSLRNAKGVFSPPNGGELRMQQSGLPHHSAVRNEHHMYGPGGVAPERGMILPFQPLSIAFSEISYYVDMPAEMKHEGVPEDRLQLLTSITGAFRPGVLTALVGVSGAGKTTLMDVLAGRKTAGYIEGDIHIAGYPKKQQTFARISGYCEQNDIHSPQVTVHESLVYSAWLRLAADINPAFKSQFVEEVMELVELMSMRDALVGLPGMTGLSTEQRKRLTIAVELVANPSIIFMDEPTSGLDARAAAIVMRTVRNTVDTGRTVVCTIHQPSIDIFEAFDEVLLLKRGGRVAYMGPLGHHSHKVVEYFEAIPGVQKICEGCNPATWMLEVSSVNVENELNIDFADLYEKSSLFMRNKALVHELSQALPGTQDLSFPTQFARSFAGQLSSCLWKQNLTYWRSPDYNLVRFVFTLITSVVFGTIFWQIGVKRDTTNDIFIVMGALYAATIFMCFNNCGTVQPVVGVERTVFYREKAAGMYSAIPYALAQVMIEILYVLIQAALYCSITYAMIGFEWTTVKFFWYFYIMFCSLLAFTNYGMMMVGLTPNAQLAVILASFFYSLFNLFSGFLIPMPLIPAWWIWYYWICPLAWTMYGLMASQYGDVYTKLTISGDIIVSEKKLLSVSQWVQDYFGFRHSFLHVVAGMLALWPVLFALIFIFSIKFLNFQRR